MDFGRLITAMVTPFNAAGEIHWEETARLIDYLIEDQKSETRGFGHDWGVANT